MGIKRKNAKREQQRNRTPKKTPAERKAEEQQAAGLFVPAIRISANAVGWPAHEVDAINAARIAGKSDDEIRALVRDLIAKRATLTISNLRILRRPEVEARTGLSRATLYVLQRQPAQHSA